MISEQERHTLRALVDRLIPRDDFPSGWEAGVGDYLDRQLAGDLAPMLEQYRAGLGGLDAEAHATGGVGFAALDPGAQDDLLRRVELGQTQAEWPVDPATFLRDAAEHAAEGYYGDPGNGGNHDEVSWRMIGFRVTG